MAFKFNASFIAGFFSAIGITCGSLAVEGKAAPLITIGNPYRHFQHQTIATGVWTEAFDGCCFATSAATVAMSIADNNVGITLNGFNNTNLGAEAFEASYRIGGTSGKVANGVAGGPLWFGDGNWVGAPWFQGPNANRLRVKDFYLGGALGNWDTIPATLPQLNVVGAFALVDAIDPLKPLDVEWWDYHVVGVYSFDFDVRSMEITDSNKDDLGAEYIDGIAVHAVGGNILKGAGVLNSLTWQQNGILANANGNGMDDERLISLRVLYLQEVPGPLPVAGAAMAFGWARKARKLSRRLHDRE